MEIRSKSLRPSMRNFSDCKMWSTKIKKEKNWKWMISEMHKFVADSFLQLCWLWWTNRVAAIPFWQMIFQWIRNQNWRTNCKHNSWNLTMSWKFVHNTTRRHTRSSSVAHSLHFRMHYRTNNVGNLQLFRIEWIRFVFRSLDSSRQSCFCDFR